MVLSTCSTKWACFNDVFKDRPLQNLFGQWACFNGVVKVDLFDEHVRHSEPASMAYRRQSQPLYWASWENELSSSEPATMAIRTLSTSLKIDPPVYQLCSSYGIVYNQHIGCNNIPFYTHVLILFNSAPSAAASAASAAASAASAAAFQLELPRTMLIHNVFHASLLQKAATDPLPGQKQTPSLPIVVNDQEEWEVNEIQNSRHFERGKQLQYQVKWHSWDRDLEWYNADSEEFENCKELTQEYHWLNSTKPGP